MFNISDFERPYETHAQNLRDKSYMTTFLRILCQGDDFGFEKITSTFIYVYDIKNSRHLKFRFMNKINPISLVTFNSFGIKKESLKQILNSIEPELFITVNRIIFINNDRELDLYCKKNNYSNGEIEDFRRFNGTHDCRSNDIVINIPNINQRVIEMPEYEEKYKNLFFLYIFLDVLLHELRHSWQYNPLFYKWSRKLLESNESIEEDAEQYMLKHHRRIVDEFLKWCDSRKKEKSL